MVQLTGIALNDRVNLPFLRKWGWLQPGVVEFEKQGQKRLGKGSPAIRCKPPVEAGFTLLSGLVRGGLCRYHPIPVVSKIPLPKTDGQRPTKASLSLLFQNYQYAKNKLTSVSGGVWPRVRHMFSSCPLW
jgi:hypothetical protein